MKYKVTYSEIFTKTVEVEADSHDQAENIIHELYIGGYEDVTMDYDTFQYSISSQLADNE